MFFQRLKNSVKYLAPFLYDIPLFFKELAFSDFFNRIVYKDLVHPHKTPPHLNGGLWLQSIYRCLPRVNADAASRKTFVTFALKAAAILGPALCVFAHATTEPLHHTSSSQCTIALDALCTLCPLHTGYAIYLHSALAN